MTSIPDITRLLARIEDWKSHAPAMGRADAARRIAEAARLLDEIRGYAGRRTPEAAGYLPGVITGYVMPA
jgi:hypothetical protein